MEKLNRKLKVFVVGGNLGYADFITKEFEIVDRIKIADIVIFTGGEDVSPSFYNELSGSRTMSNPERDLEEDSYFNSINGKKGVLLIGICRGAQFLTVMSGGSLIQHVNNHGISGTHQIEIVGEGRCIDITSTHHQMMYPFYMDKSDYKIIAKSKVNLSDVYLGGCDSNIGIPSNFVEPEIVYYPKTNALCIQGHPEYMDKKSKAVKFINMLMDELLEENMVINQNNPANQLIMRLRQQVLLNDAGIDNVINPVDFVIE